MEIGDIEMEERCMEYIEIGTYRGKIERVKREMGEIEMEYGESE